MPIQAYQLLRNCGAELMYEAPNTRVELAHFFWDKLEEQGKEVCVWEGELVGGGREGTHENFVNRSCYMYPVQEKVL